MSEDRSVYGQNKARLGWKFEWLSFWYTVTWQDQKWLDLYGLDYFL